MWQQWQRLRTFVCLPIYTPDFIVLISFILLGCDKQFVVACTHLYWDPKDNDVKVGLLLHIFVSNNLFA